MHGQEFSVAGRQPRSVLVTIRHNVSIIVEIMMQAEGMAQFVGCCVKLHFAIKKRKATIFRRPVSDSSDLTAHC